MKHSSPTLIGRWCGGMLPLRLPVGFSARRFPSFTALNFCGCQVPGSAQQEDV